MKTLKCNCYLPDHVVLIEQDGPELYIYTQLSSKSFFGRVWAALKYVFKRDGSHWEETILNKEECLKLARMCRDVKNWPESD